MSEQVQVQPQRTVCQSCGMPIERADQRGTTASGARSADYCSSCYRDGHFAEPNLTRQQMISRAVDFLVTGQGMPVRAARALAHGLVPTLKRWLN